MDLRAGRLLRSGEPVALRPKTWAVLRYLADRPGVLVTKDELLDSVWTDTAVTEAVLSKSIGELRAAFGDDFKAPRFIETVQRRGFRLISPLDPPSLESEVPLLELATPDAGPHTVFVGRAEELRQLVTLFAKASAGERQIVFLTGSAGMGKTALAEAFAASPTVREATSPVWVSRGLCVEQHGSNEAYHPVLEALERLARRPDGGRLVRLLSRVAPTWLAQMPWLFREDGQALQQLLQTGGPARMLREFVALVEALTTYGTLVLILEDLHWSDPSTVDLLAMLAERREPARLLVIGTFRPADAIVHEHALISTVRTLQLHRRCMELPLSELIEDGVRRYLDARFVGNDFPPALARLIHEHTDGHPLFVVAVVDHLLSKGHILDTSPGWALTTSLSKLDLGVPADVRLMIEEQIDGLSPADRTLLRAASVVGQEFAAPVVAAALDCAPEDIETRCEALAQAQRFLRVAGHVQWPDRSVSRRYSFAHDVYRQAVYAEIPDEQCTRLHQRVGLALEAAYGVRRSEIAPQLAVHFERGRDDARALHYLRAAAASAQQRLANREAIAYFETILALLAFLPDEDERLRQELEVRLPLGSALSEIYGFASDQVRANYDRAAELGRLVGSTEQLFEILYARAHFHAVRAEPRETTAILAELDGLARRSGTADQLLRAACGRMRCAVWEGRFLDAIELTRNRLPQQQVPEGHMRLGGYGAHPLIDVESCAAIAWWFLGHPDRARTIAHAAVDRARESGHFFTIALTLVQAALVELFCRRISEGADLAEQAFSMSAAHGFTYWNLSASVLRGWAAIQQGRAPEGTREVARALAAMHAAGMRVFSTFAHAFIAEGHVRAGALADGLDAANTALREAPDDHACAPELWRLKGEILLASAEPERPRRRHGSTTTSTAAAESRSQEAERCLQRALELARASQAKSLELRAATSLARALRARGKSSEARRLLGGVCKWFGMKADSADLSDARALLAELRQGVSQPNA